MIKIMLGTFWHKVEKANLCLNRDIVAFLLVMFFQVVVKILVNFQFRTPC